MPQVTNKDIYDQVEKLRLEMRETYVTKEAFDPVKRLVYGLVALLLTAVIGAMLGLVIVDTSRTNVATTSNK
jgi:hypothetical protein